MRHYSVSESEVEQLSFMNPIAASLIGYGVTLASNWISSPEAQRSSWMAASALFMLTLGIVIQWRLRSFWRRLRDQCRDDAGS